MRIQNIRAIHGPNVISHNPVLVMRLDLQDLTGKESYEIPGFVDRLIEALPGVREHYCGLGRPGGFVERLRGGTYFGHIVEHVAIELSQHAGIPVNRGKTIGLPEHGVYEVTVVYTAERAMAHLLRTAVDLVQAVLDDRPFPIDDALACARQLAKDYEFGPSTKAVVDAAVQRGIPVTRVTEDSLVRLGYGRES